MAIVLSKKKAAAKAPAAPAVNPGEILSDFAYLIDNVGQLAKEAELIEARIKKEQAKLKPYEAALKKLKAEIEKIVADPDEVIVQLGAHYRVEAGKRGTSRKISDIQQVRKMMGDELFFECATVALKDIDNYLTKPQRDKVITIERSSRSIKIEPRGT